MFGLFKQKKVDCPDGPKFIFRNIDDAFKTHVQGHERSVKTKGKGIESIEGEISGESKTKIDGVLYNLDFFNNSIQMEFRAIYITFVSDPCNNAKMFTDKINELVAKYNNLNLLKLKIYGLVEAIKSGNVNDLNFSENYIRLVSEHGEFLPSQSASLSIEQARNTFNRLNPGSNEEE